MLDAVGINLTSSIATNANGQDVASTQIGDLFSQLLASIGAILPSEDDNSSYEHDQLLTSAQSLPDYPTIVPIILNSTNAEYLPFEPIIKPEENLETASQSNVSLELAQAELEIVENANSEILSEIITPLITVPLPQNEIDDFKVVISEQNQDLLEDSNPQTFGKFEAEVNSRDLESQKEGYPHTQMQIAQLPKPETPFVYEIPVELAPITSIMNGKIEEVGLPMRILDNSSIVELSKQTPNIINPLEFTNVTNDLTEQEININNTQKFPLASNIAKPEPNQQNDIVIQISNEEIEVKTPTNIIQEEFALVEVEQLEVAKANYDETKPETLPKAEEFATYTDNDNNDNKESQSYEHSYESSKAAEFKDIDDIKSITTLALDNNVGVKPIQIAKLFNAQDTPHSNFTEFRENNYENIKAIIDANTVELPSGKIANKIVKFELNPKELGSIEISFENDDILSRTKVSIVSERYQTHEMVQKLAKEIENIVQANNSSGQDISLNFSLNHNTKNFNSYVKSLENAFTLTHQETASTNNYISAVDYSNLNLEKPINILA